MELKKFIKKRRDFRSPFKIVVAKDGAEHC